MIQPLNQNTVTEIYTVTIHCKLCSSPDVIRFGTHKNVQRYYCKDCHHKFAGNGALPFMRISTDIMGSALNAYYEGMPYAAIRRHLKQAYNYQPSNSTIYDWVLYFTQVAIDKAKGYKTNTGEIWVADETVSRIGGWYTRFWDIIDDKTRFLLASHIPHTGTTKDAETLMGSALERSRLRPTFYLTDKLQAYLQGVKGFTMEHYRSHGFNSKVNASFIKRFHGNLEDRTKVMKRLKSEAMGKLIMGGWLVHYNFFRPHEGLGNRTPGEVAGVEFPYRNWGEIITIGTGYG